MDTRHLTGPSEKGSVLLDIGGDVGAAIITTEASFVGSEIEVRRCGTAWDGTHVAVRARHVSGGVVHAALFSGLRQGRYEVRVRGDADGPTATLVVEGGRVMETHLPVHVPREARPHTAHRPAQGEGAGGSSQECSLPSNGVM
jgi:hypothetical protein